jgi:hypothetical protein
MNRVQGPFWVACAASLAACSGLIGIDDRYLVSDGEEGGTHVGRPEAGSSDAARGDDAGGGGTEADSPAADVSDDSGLAGDAGGGGTEADSPTADVSDDSGLAQATDTGDNGLADTESESLEVLAYRPDSGAMNLLWHDTTTGDLQVWAMKGPQMAGMTNFDLTVTGLDWQLGGLGDFNADGFDDILWNNVTTGEVDVWLMNGTTRLSIPDLTENGSGSPLMFAGPNWGIAGVADFNSDGKPDVLWHNVTTGQNQVWMMNGTTRTAYVDLTTALAGQDWECAGTGDFDGNGSPDIVWHNTNTGDVQLWLMNGTTMTSSLDLSQTRAGTDWQLRSVPDYNGDGQVELLWRNVTTGQIQLWLMTGTAYAGSANITPSMMGSDWKIGGTSRTL